MSQNEESRADKFLWSVRIFKTRSIAAEACKKSRVLIGDSPLKPSKSVKPGNIITIKKPPVNYTYKVLSLPRSRISAKLVPDYIENLTPEKELNKLEMRDSFFITRDRGTGRPTKKERRDIDKLKGK